MNKHENSSMEYKKTLKFN